MKNLKEDIETLWRTYNSINDWIKFSDSKATALLAINGVILSIIFSNLPKVWILVQGDILKVTLVLTGILITIYFIFATILFSISCLYPKMDKKYRNGLNLLYYKDIAENFNSSDEYLKSSEKMFNNDLELKNQIAKEIFENSTIANNKYKKVKSAIYSFGIAITSTFLSILIILIFDI